MNNKKKVILGIAVASAAAIGLFSLIARAAPPEEYSVNISNIDIKEV